VHTHTENVEDLDSDNYAVSFDCITVDCSMIIFGL
jgi:hypothetical protein